MLGGERVRSIHQSLQAAHISEGSVLVDGTAALHQGASKEREDHHERREAGDVVGGLHELGGNGSEDLGRRVRLDQTTQFLLQRVQGHLDHRGIALSGVLVGWLTSTMLLLTVNNILQRLNGLEGLGHGGTSRGHFFYCRRRRFLFLLFLLFLLFFHNKLFRLCFAFSFLRSVGLHSTKT